VNRRERRKLEARQGASPRENFTADDALGSMLGRLGGRGKVKAAPPSRGFVFDMTLAATSDALRGRRDFAALRESLAAAFAFADQTYAAAAERRRLDPQGNKPACAPGCRYCCHQSVSVSSYEAVNILLHLRDIPATRREEMARRVQATAEATRGASDDDIRLRRIACPFLDPDGRCAVYVARPFPCRAYVSTDLGVCRSMYDEPAPANAQRREGTLPRVFDVDARQIFDDALQGAANALHRGGYAYRHLDLVAAMAIGIASADTPERWLAGEPVFDAARKATP